MIKRKKIITFMLTISCSLLIMINTVYAFDYMEIGWATTSFGGTSTSGSGGGEESEPPKTGDINLGESTYYCTYESTFEPKTTKRISGYDIDGTSIAKNNSVNSSLSFKAGTWIGININETRLATWSVKNIKYYKKTKIYTCKYSYTDKWLETYECANYTTSSSRSNCSNFCSVEGYAHSKTLEGNRCYCYTNCTDPKSKTYYKEYDIEVEYNAEAKCPTTHPDDSKYKNPVLTYKDDNNAPIDSFEELETQCKLGAVSVVKGRADVYVSAPTSKVRYIDINDYPNDPNDIYSENSTEILEGELNPTKSEFEKQLYPQGETYGTEVGIFEYKPDMVCLNVKTGDVEYREDEDCKENEYNVTSYTKNGTSYWKYFIPLNSKTNYPFFINLEKNNNQRLEPEECYDVMDKYSNYEEYIIKFTEEKTIRSGKNQSYKFLGRDEDGEIPNKDLKYIKNNGCYFSTTVEFNVSQEFYNEDNEKIIFNGFNFYYRPIDVNNPFPTGVADNSLWKDVWNKDKNDETNDVRITDSTNTTTTIDLSKSFNNITYKATNINASTVREDTKKYKYTDWTKMNVDGSSEFIKTSGIFSEKADSSSYYKLGCGPSNKDLGECK